MLKTVFKQNFLVISGGGGGEGGERGRKDLVGMLVCTPKGTPKPFSFDPVSESQ